ncbi:MAG: PD40 domain-containing protein, partial [Candidatus Krumholzibacteriota bacterium]|nr:PD40 domain-containing protein [Candidatus Krumholzibacteriota bacterium]
GKAGSDYDIWVMDRVEGGWSDPRPLEGPVNSEQDEYFPSVTRGGTIYFCRAEPETRIHYIYRSRLVDGSYQEPEKLPEAVNCGRSQFNATISPDEDFIIVPVAGRQDGVGGVDYYICFRDQNDNWTGPVNMGDKINTPGSQEYSANLSPDGRYLFFMSVRSEEREGPMTYQDILEMMDRPRNGNSNIYWMSAGFIEELRASAGEVNDDR